MRASVSLVLAGVVVLGACDGPSETAARQELQRLEEERERERAAAEQEAAEHLMTFGFVGTEPGDAAPAADIEAPEPYTGRPGASDAERFVRWLYGGMASGEIELTSAEDARAVWTAENARTFEALGDGDRAFLTVNPLCACGDASRVVVRSVEITPTGPATAQARVGITGGGRDQVQLALVREAAGWRLADVPGA